MSKTAYIGVERVILHAEDHGARNPLTTPRRLSGSPLSGVSLRPELRAVPVWCSGPLPTRCGRCLSSGKLSQVAQITAPTAPRTYYGSRLRACLGAFGSLIFVGVGWWLIHHQVGIRGTIAGWLAIIFFGFTMLACVTAVAIPNRLIVSSDGFSVK